MSKTLTSVRKKAIALAKKIAVRRGRCEKCGRRADAGYMMHGAHIMPVNYYHMAADLDNLMCLCSRCHVFDPDSWHQSPFEATKWFEEQYPGRKEELQVRAHTFVKLTIKDWEEKYQSLLTIYENNL